MQVRITPGDRCLSSCWTNSTTPAKANWPDTPWDLQCSVAPCANSTAPSFWTAKRLAKIATFVYSGGAYKPID